MKKTIYSIENSYCLLGISIDIAEQLDAALNDVPNIIKEDVWNILKSANKNSRNSIAMSFIKKEAEARSIIDYRMMDASHNEITVAAKISALKFSILKKEKPNLNSKELIELFYNTENSEEIPELKLPLKLSKDFSEKLCSVKYLIKKINLAISQNREFLAMKLGLISKYGNSPVTKAAINELKLSKRKTDSFIKNKVIMNTNTGKFQPLSSVSHQDNKRYAETLCLLNGLNEYAISVGYSAAFVTITVPGSFRINNKSSKQLLPDEINKYIQKKWNIYRKKSSQWVSPCYIFRVIEPHLDGTPHWHLMLFFPSHMREKHKTSLLNAFGLKTTRSKRIDWRDICLHDKKTIGYLVGKIKRNFGPNNTIHDSNNNAKRVAYLSIWKINGHDFLGFPSKTKNLWRNLKTIKYYHQFPGPLQQMKEMVKNKQFADFFEFFLKHEKQIGIITALTESGKSKKVIGIKWNNQVYLSKNPEYKIMSELQANQLKIEKNREIILNKPSNTKLPAKKEVVRNKIHPLPKLLGHTVEFPKFKSFVKRLWGLLINLVHR